MNSTTAPPPPPDCFHGLSYSFPKMMTSISSNPSITDCCPSSVSSTNSSFLHPIIATNVCASEQSNDCCNHHHNNQYNNQHTTTSAPQLSLQQQHNKALSMSNSVKQCANYKCGTTKTPLWRKGWCVEEASSKNNFKPKTVFLCNKCGLHYRKGHYCKECLEIFKESDMRNEKQFWLICNNCNQWIHKKCMKDSANNAAANDTNCSSYTCCECVENPNRTVNNKRKKPTTSKKAQLKQQSDEDESEESFSPNSPSQEQTFDQVAESSIVLPPSKRRVQHYSSPQSPPTQPVTASSPTNYCSSPQSMPLKKRIKNQSPPSPLNLKMSLSPRSSGSMARIYSKITNEIDGYTTETSSPTTSETEDVDYSLAFSPPVGTGIYYFNQPMNSRSAIDVLASICEQLQ